MATRATFQLWHSASVSAQKQVTQEPLHQMARVWTSHTAQSL